MAVTDGAAIGPPTATNLGAGGVLWHPSPGVFASFRFGVVPVAGNSTDAERLAKIGLLVKLGSWTGKLFVLTDSVAALSMGFTSAPKQSTMLNVLLRHVMQFLRVALYEGWLPAQEDSGEQTLPAYLNALADAEAAEGATSAKAIYGAVPSGVCGSGAGHVPWGTTA